MIGNDLAVNLERAATGQARMIVVIAFRLDKNRNASQAIGKHHVYDRHFFIAHLPAHFHNFPEADGYHVYLPSAGDGFIRSGGIGSHPLRFAGLPDGSNPATVDISTYGQLGESILFNY